MTLLIVILLSNLDGSYKSHKQIATYEHSIVCENVKEELNKRSYYSKYLCVKEIK